MKIRMLHKLVLAFLSVTVVFILVCVYLLKNMERAKTEVNNLISLQKEIDYFKNIDSFLIRAEKIVNDIYSKKEDLKELTVLIDKFKNESKKVSLTKEDKLLKILEDLKLSFIDLSNIERRGGIDYIRAKTRFKNLKKDLNSFLLKNINDIEEVKLEFIRKVRILEEKSKIFSWYGIVLGVFISLIVGGLLAWYESRRLKQGVKLAKAIEEGDFEAKCELKGSDEIVELVKKVEDIKDKLILMEKRILEQKKEVQRGNILFRISEAEFVGGFREIVAGTNKVVEIFTEHLNNAPIPLMSLDKDMNILFLNKIGLEVIGKDFSEVKNGKCYKFFNTEDCQTERCACKQVILSGDNCVSETIARPQGEEIYIKYFGNPIVGEKGEIIGAFEYVLDITDIKKAQLKLSELAKDGEIIGERLVSAAEELSAQVEQSSKGSKVQKQRAEETATAMEEMNASVLEVAKNASVAAENAEKAKEVAEEGARVVEKTIRTILEVKEQANFLVKNMQSLQQQAEDIGKVVGVISDIADQTNLLALNAAIEAARAGDAGRGFAVVADEVRKLAEKTMGATKEVEESITSIQSVSKDNFVAMEKMDKIVISCSEEAELAGKALKRIVEMSQNTLAQVQAIATASEEQSTASEQIAKSTEEINRISEETSRAMQDAADAIAELSRLAQNLNTIISEMTRI